MGRLIVNESVRVAESMCVSMYAGDLKLPRLTERAVMTQDVNGFGVVDAIAHR